MRSVFSDLLLISTAMKSNILRNIIRTQHLTTILELAKGANHLSLEYLLQLWIGSGLLSLLDRIGSQFSGISGFASLSTLC